MSIILAQCSCPLFEKCNQGWDIIDIAAFSALDVLDIRPPVSHSGDIKGRRVAPDADQEGMAM